ncbi:MAG: RNA polymerase sigma factor [Clostridia bacterium]|nr:RNA polymerase sigma factor [Clostridia bacterium]
MNEAAFTALCKAYMDGLYRISLSILHAHQDAQDAVQQALLKAWTARAKARPGCERAWLTRIVINECRSIQRQRLRVFPVETLPERPCHLPDSTLRDATDALPELLRLPLLLKYMEGMSEKEAAQALGVTVTVLKGRLFRARKALGKLLNEEVELG